MPTRRAADNPVGGGSGLLHSVQFDGEVDMLWWIVVSVPVGLLVVGTVGKAIVEGIADHIRLSRMRARMARGEPI